MKKIVITLTILLLAILIMANLNHLYIMVKKPFQFPYPPYEAKQAGDFIVYNNGHFLGMTMDNKDNLESFIEQISLGKKASLKIVDYRENINPFTNFYFSAPEYVHHLDYKQGRIEYSYQNIDQISRDMRYLGHLIVDLKLHEVDEAYQLLFITDTLEEVLFLTVPK